MPALDFTCVGGRQRGARWIAEPFSPITLPQTSWLKTPSWSAFHSAEFGHGELVIKNATAAVWTWHRNSDREDIIADTYVVVNTHTA